MGVVAAGVGEADAVERPPVGIGERERSTPTATTRVQLHVHVRGPIVSGGARRPDIPEPLALPDGFAGSEGAIEDDVAEHDSQTAVVSQPNSQTAVADPRPIRPSDSATDRGDHRSTTGRSIGHDEVE